MKNLVRCTNKLAGKILKKHEVARLLEDAREYQAEGYAAPEAERRAVEDTRTDVEENMAGALEQIGREKPAVLDHARILAGQQTAKVELNPAQKAFLAKLQAQDSGPMEKLLGKDSPWLETLREEMGVEKVEPPVVEPPPVAEAVEPPPVERLDPIAEPAPAPEPTAEPVGPQEAMASLSASKAKPSDKVEAPKPEPYPITREQGKAVRDSYAALVKDSGFPAVSIGELAEKSGVPIDKLKAQLERSWREGKVVLSKGDWSLADERTKGGAVQVNGERYLQARLLDQRALEKAPEPKLSLAASKAEDSATRKASMNAFQAVYRALSAKMQGVKREGNVSEGRDKIAAGFDAADTMASAAGERAGNSIRLDLPEAKDRDAMPFIIEAGGDKAKLQEFREQIATSKDLKLSRRYLPVIDHAIADFDRLHPRRRGHDFIMGQGITEMKDAGVSIGEVENYVTRRLEQPEAEGEMEINPLFSTGSGGGGTSRYFTKGRSFDTLADAIHSGYAPKSTDLAVLDHHRITAGRRIIEQKRFFDRLKSTPSPIDGKPMIGKMESRETRDGKKEQVIPHGYSVVTAAGQPLVVHKDFAPLFRDLYGQSGVRQHLVGRMLLKSAAFAKHGTLVLDTFHVGRLLFKMATGGGGSPVVFRDGKPAFGYHAGRALLEYTDADLGRAQQAGDLTKDEVAYAKENRPKADELIAAGLNVGKVADNLMEQAQFHMPVIDKVNGWIFQKLSRGAMLQTALTFYDRNLKRPGISRGEAARRTAREANEYFGNLQSQGLFKSKTFQDIARLVFLAPNWTESQFRYEARSYGQVGAAALDAARGKGVRLGNATRAMATGFAALLAVNQLINLITRGKPTFANDEDDHKLDAFIPGGRRGFWFNPFEIAGEFAHAAHKYLSQGENAADAAAHIASNKLSPLARGIKEAATGRDAQGRHFLNDTDRFRSSIVDASPFPLPLGSVIEKDPRQPLGIRATRAPGAIQKQLMQSVGAKVTAAQSPRTQMFALAKPFRPDGQYSDSAGEYTELRRALDNDQPDAVKTEIEWLLDRGKDMPAIARALGIHAGGLHREMFTGGADREKEMIRSLTPKQLEVYAAAQRDHAESAHRFLTISHTPEVQSIIVQAKRKAAERRTATR